MNKDENTTIYGQLCRILGIGNLDQKFGEPFIKAFSAFIPDEEEKILAASYTCALFLSAIFNGLPTAKLNTFVHLTKEQYRRFSFNCKIYEDIFSHIGIDDLESVALLDKNGNHSLRTCTKNDIFEAFDFYTNI